MPLDETGVELDEDKLDINREQCTRGGRRNARRAVEVNTNRRLVKL